MLLKILNNEGLKEIKDIKNLLLNYNEYIKLFIKDFEERKRNSIFEFLIISFCNNEREDFQKFEKKKNSPNREFKLKRKQKNKVNMKKNK